MRIKFVSIPVADQDRAKHFYADALGFTVSADNPMGEGRRWIDLQPPGGAPDITLVTWFNAMPAGSVKGLVLEVDDVDATYAAMEARGVTFTSKPENQEWGRLATFDDPDGNGWVLMGPVTSS